MNARSRSDFERAIGPGSPAQAHRRASHPAHRHHRPPQGGWRLADRRLPASLPPWGQPAAPLATRWAPPEGNHGCQNHASEEKMRAKIQNLKEWMGERSHLWPLRGRLTRRGGGRQEALRGGRAPPSLDHGFAPRFRCFLCRESREREREEEGVKGKRLGRPNSSCVIVIIA